MATSVLIFASSAGLYALYNHFDNNVTRIPDVFHGDHQAADIDEPLNLLLVGSASRAGMTEEELAASHTTQDDGPPLADTIMVVHIPADATEATVVSLPRDSWVTIPAWTNPRTGERVSAHKAKINSAFAIGSHDGTGNAALLVDTVENLTGVEIDHYAQIDFNGFRGMVDALGGVEICTPTRLYDTYSGIDLEAGRHTLDGEQALAFVRQRKGVGVSSGIDRIGHQQQVISSIVRDVTSAGTLLNPIELLQFLEVMTDSIDVDGSLGTDDLRRFALHLRHLKPDNVVFTTLPFTDLSVWRDDHTQLAVSVDKPAMRALFDRILSEDRGDSGDEGDGDQQTQKDLIVAPEDIRVEVFNGAGVDNLAAHASQDLAEVGFQVVGQPANRGTGADETVVRHGPDRADSARTLAAAVGGARLVLDRDLGDTLEVVLGSDYDGAHDVSVGESGAGSGGSGDSGGRASDDEPAVTTAANASPCTAAAG